MKSVLTRAGLPISLGIAALIFAIPAVSHAQATKPKPTAPAAPTGSYTYVAQPGDSLSLLVRKSLQLYDTEQKDVQLSPAAAMYAETNVVQKLGAPLLDINQTVAINKADLAGFCTSSKNLTADQLAAWQVYADQANFDVANIKPTSPVAAAAPTTKTPPPAPAPTPTPTPKDETKKDESTKSETKKEETPKSAQNTNTSDNDKDDAAAKTADKASTSGNAPWYWWLVGAGTLGILYYLLSGRQTGSTKK